MLTVRRVSAFLSLLTLCAGAATAQEPAAGCDLGFDGKARAAAKNRKPADGVAYEVHGDSEHPLTFAKWFTLTCSLDKKRSLPLKIKDAQGVLAGIEPNTVTVKGFIVAVKWDADNDLHIQLAPTPAFKVGQILLEIPAFQEFCDARTTMWNLIHEDEKKGGNKVTKGKGRIMKTPVLVEATGFVFFDGHHGDTNNGCSKPHISGIHGRLKASPIKGMWELHPVIALRTANP